MIDILFAGILLLMSYQLWKSSKTLSKLLKLQELRDFDDLLEQKFQHIFLDYKEDIRNYWNRFKRSEKSPNPENWGMHWSLLHMAITNKYKLESTEYQELDRLRLETGKLIESKKESLNQDELDFLAWMLWNELVEINDIQRISQEFSVKAKKIFRL